MYNDIRGCPDTVSAVWATDASSRWQFLPAAEILSGGLTQGALDTPGIQERKKAHPGLEIRVGFRLGLAYLEKAQIDRCPTGAKIDRCVVMV